MSMHGTLLFVRTFAYIMLALVRTGSRFITRKACVYRAQQNDAIITYNTSIRYHVLQCMGRSGCHSIVLTRLFAQDDSGMVEKSDVASDKPWGLVNKGPGQGSDPGGHGMHDGGAENTRRVLSWVGKKKRASALCFSMFKEWFICLVKSSVYCQPRCFPDVYDDEFVRPHDNPLAGFM